MTGLQTVCFRAALLIAVLGLSVASAQQASPEVPIGTIDFFGLRKLSVETLRPALTLKPGDSLSPGKRPASLDDTQRRLAAIPGVLQAQVNAVCCTDGRVSLFVGVLEEGGRTLTFHEAARGKVRLEPGVLEAGEAFEAALRAALQQGQAAEDDSQGHAIASDSGLRAVQERFIAYARTGTPRLRKVLRESADANHRALAAQVIGYTEEKQAVVADLVFAMRDPDSRVRNNAMRTLVVFSAMTPAEKRSVVRVPYDPFIALLESQLFTDRNKASAALAQLTRNGDPQLLALLRREAMIPLVEMARWNDKGHALFAFSIVARMAEYSDDDALKHFFNNDRETVIAAALSRP